MSSVSVPDTLLETGASSTAFTVKVNDFESDRDPSEAVTVIVDVPF